VREELTARLLARVVREFRPLWQTRGRRHFVLRFHVGPGITFLEATMARITTEEQVGVSVAPKTAHGRPASIDGVVDFVSSDPAVASVESTGPLTAVVKAVNPGVAQIIAVFDADLGEGVRAIEMTGAIEVVPAEAVTAEIVFGTPESQA
jgi:hypothetical protein